MIRKNRSTLARSTLTALPLSLMATALNVALAPAEAQESAGLEEIVVTARYREESVQTTPISISAFSGVELELRSIENVEDLGLVVPNAYFRRNVSNFGPNNTIGLRGLNQVDFSYAFEPSVGVYIDDVYHSTMTGSDMDLVDLDRVEVLRGPQGTLFGKNSLGGAVRMISRKPQGDNSGLVQVTYGDYDRLDIKAMGDIELVEDKVFARLIGLTKEREGYGASLDFTCEMIRRGTPQLAGVGDGIVGWNVTDPDGTGPLTAGPIMGTVGSAADNAFSFPAQRDVLQGDGCELGKLGGGQSDSGRVMLRFVPSDRLELNVSADFLASRDDPNVDAQLSQPGGALNIGYDTGVVQPRYGIRFTADDRFVTGDPYTNYATFADVVNGQTYPRDATMDASGLSLVVEYSLGENTGMKVILADRGYDNEWTNDSDRTPFGLTQTHYVQNHDQEQAELQFNGAAANGRLGWAAGLFYFSSESRAYNTTEFEAFAFSGLLPNFVANDGFGTDNESVFVHLTYDLTDRFSVSGGARYTDEEKWNTFAHIGQIVVDDPLVFGRSRTDWKASLEFSATDDLFFYVQAATGFTSDGATPRIFTPGQLKSIQGEEVLSYEIGAKMDFFDSRLRINTAVYASEYDPRVRTVGGVRQCDPLDDPDPFPYRVPGGGVCPPGTFFGDLVPPTNGQAWFYYDNVPGKLDGFEIEVSASPIENLLITYSAGTNHYENDDNTVTSANYINPDYLFQPEWNMSFGLQYGISFANGGRLTPRVDAFYQSERHTGPSNARPGIHEVLANTCPRQCLPAYTIVNARLTYEPPAGDWRLSLAGTNVTDKFYWQQYSQEVAVNAVTGVVTNANPTDRTGVASRPREWALTLEKRF